MFEHVVYFLYEVSFYFPSSKSRSRSHKKKEMFGWKCLFLHIIIIFLKNKLLAKKILLFQIRDKKSSPKNINTKSKNTKTQGLK